MENRNRLELQIKQVKSLLGEFRKTKMKCLELCQKLNRDLPNLLQYEIMEVTCTRKIDTFDILGVIKLKNQLLANLNEISQAERDMTYEIQKNSFKKVIKTAIPARLNREPSIVLQEMGPFEIPSYQSKIQSNQNKVDRLSAFILTLGRSMTTLRKCILGEWEWDQQNFYKHQPQYLEIVKKIQLYKMKEEDLIHSVQRKYEKQLQNIINKGQKQQIKDYPDYYMVKISKKAVERGMKGLKNKDKQRSFQYDKPYHSVSLIQPKRKPFSKKLPLQRINEEKVGGQSERFDIPKFASDTSLDFYASSFQKNHTQSRIGHRLIENSQMQETQGNNYVYMVKRISPESQLNSSAISSISSLRSMRKKVFDDDIWDQFEKI